MKKILSWARTTNPNRFDAMDNIGFGMIACGTILCCMAGNEFTLLVFFPLIVVGAVIMATSDMLRRYRDKE